MSAKDVIAKIIGAKTMKDVFPDISNWKTTYKEYLLLIHPDRCQEHLASQASAKLNEFKTKLEDGQTIEDEAGIITYRMNTVKIKGDKGLLKLSVDRYRLLMSLPDSQHAKLKKYLPESVKIISENEIEFILRDRAIPISDLGTLPQEHVNWIFSRMLEFAGYINKTGHVHCGINPNSIFVHPEGHGISCISFYHVAGVNARVRTVCGQYEHFYPAVLFKEKKATTDIDVELAKRTAIYLLGDKSGIGVKLKKTHNEKFLDFTLQRHDDPIEAFFLYRKFLDANFPKKFHVLNI